ncbi:MULTISPECIES: DksA/TraR family C4-type zinc finger protein [unclassified Neisseria]|uniref:DksA/TraR family C4-type zinc finger protein n=1 Tax=unclassified Neisseria TaxID=2623750 RepID=UPI002666E5B1|nr:MULTISPECIES: DksA/TraR family C4-type zinc finger protein [unclassified Neisseria]MDO1509309.1 DksA/TraR family C4-type zinc finger protein [Neisseria sp. MVDL19-042950]MDO1515412.1 DksA/TraR family C4-type zinc finger protein [Neisseria sp. MVDL18-041461]MDO1562772.1 DksA/TraR family C4-type zinc finger protein [Neisseria sp. MVDL20-010259]
MAGGWAPDGAEQEQIEASLEDALALVRQHLPAGESARECIECGEPIPEARRQALPGVQLCIACQEQADKQQAFQTAYNRRGSKDSQLK